MASRTGAMQRDAEPLAGAPESGTDACRPLRVYYAAGPGDVVTTFRHWKAGCDDPNQISVTYSHQFFGVCKELGAKALVASWNPRVDRAADEDFVVLNRPRHPWTKLGGWRYHLGEQIHLLSAVASALRWRADVMLLGGGGHLALLGLLPWGRMRLIVDSANVLWPTHLPRRRSEALLRRLERRVYRTKAMALTSVSRDVTGQLTDVAGGRPRPVLEYLPLYRNETFRRDPFPAHDGPFRVVFAGRVEPTKGVRVLVELARRFRRGGHAIVIEVCGTGGGFDELRGCVERESLSACLVLHGYCQRDRLAEIYARAHAVIVPTTRSFVEGFNMVVAEAVLAGRPVVTSAVCPAIHYLGGGVVEVPADDVDAYERALIRLAGDPDLCARIRSDGAAAATRLYDPANSFGAALRSALEAARAGRSPEPREIPVARAVVLDEGSVPSEGVAAAGGG